MLSHGEWENWQLLRQGEFWKKEGLEGGVWASYADAERYGNRHTFLGHSCRNDN